MPRRDLQLLLIVLAALVLASCGTGGRNAKAGRVKSVEQIAPRYDIRDDTATKQRMAQQEKLGLAFNRMQGGDYAAAEQLVREVLRKEPKSVDAYTILAVIQGSRGDATAAGESYRRAAELAPKQGDVLNNYGAWLCGNGYPAEALVWFDRAMADPRYGSPAAVLANSGGCALQVGQTERGVRDLRKALELDPANAYALESMARHEYAGHRYFEARAFSERRLAAAPASTSVLQLAIQIEQGLGDKAAASRYQQRLSKEFPEGATANPGANAL
ncbi:MAG TPA: type IV pilus biogenesis/stability protein PilW [Xanthomonadaceae bacterium]|nr:type IV pilus biogenesis/stability protein PilW [Xanthomonadaceae bacterium]